jgi:hypothetical protein
MKIDQPALDPSATRDGKLRAGHRHRMSAVAMLTALVCSGATSCTRTQVALSAAAIGAVIVGTTVGVTYAVKHHNHTLQGCVSSDANGLKLRTSDAKVYALKGDTASIKVGDSLQFHGSKVKKAKGDSSGDRVFEVEKLNRDYGPCPANVATSPTPTQ